MKISPRLKIGALCAVGVLLGGASFVGGGLSTAGGYSIVLTSTGNTTLTLPTSGTLATSGTIPMPATQVIGRLLGANFNSTADQAITLSYTGSGFLPSTTASGASAGAVAVKNCTDGAGAQKTPTSAAGTVYAGAGKTGILFGAVGDVYTTANALTKVVRNSASGNATINFLTITTAYLSLTVANGSALTCDVYILGTVLP